MKYFKWILLAVGTTLAVIFIAILCIQFYLNTEQVRQRIQVKVNKAIPGTITWSQNRFSLLSGKAELNRVILTGPENDTLVEIERFSVHISWARLLKRELAVHDLLLENPSVYLAIDRSGSLNLIQALYTPSDKPSESGGNGGLLANILFRQLRVINGMVQYNTAKEMTETNTDQVVLQKVNITITDGNLLKQSGRLVCEIAGGKIKGKEVQTTIRHLFLKAGVQKDRIDGLHIDVNTDGIHADITGTLENFFTDKPILNLRLKSRVSLSNIKELTTLGTDFSGVVQANSIFKGTLDNPDIDLLFDYEGGNIAGTRIDRMHLDCRFKEKILNINGVDLYTPLGRFNIKGDVDFSKAFAQGILAPNPDLDAIAYKFSLHQKDTHLANLPSGMSGFKGIGGAEVELEGKGVYPKTLRAKTALRMTINKLAAGKGDSSFNVHMSALAEMDKGRITIQNLSAGTGESLFEMSGNYDLNSHQVAAHFKLEAPDLDEIMTNSGINAVSGKVHMRGDVSGTLKKPSVDARLIGDNLSFGSIKFGKADMNIGLSNGHIYLKDGKIFNGNSQLDISGYAQIYDPRDYNRIKNPDFDVVIKGDTLLLEDFVQGAKGKFVLNGGVKGTMEHPKGQIDLKGDNVDLNIQTFSEIKLATIIDESKIHVDPLSLIIAPGEKIILNGWISMDKNYDLSIISNDISLKNITKIAPLKIDSGRISLDISGNGAFENPRLSGNVVLRDLGFHNQRLEKVPFEIKVENQIAYLSGGMNFNLDAAYGLQSRSFSTSARFDNTDLTPYFQLIGNSELRGTITGSIESKGIFGTPIQVEGTTRISQLEIFWKDKPLVEGSELMLLFHNDELSIPGMRLSLFDEGYFTIKGSGQINKDLNLEAHGNIPLEILPIFTETINDATGDIRFSLNVNGSLSSPTVTLHGNIENGGMTVPGLFQKLHRINGGIRLTSDAIVLDDINGMLDNGKFEFNGTIDLDQYQPSNIELELKADNLPVSIPDLLDIRLNSELNIRGSSEKSLIKGDILIIEGTYEKDVRLNLVESIGQETRKGPLPTPKTPWPIFNNMVVDCKIRYREPFVVDNNIALLTIKPDLNIHGTVNQPLISGRAEVESGTVSFQRNEFNVKKGVFDFINPYKIEPTIDIQSEVNIRKWTIFLKISGTPDNLRFDMTSDPPEREEDIISLLISGKTTQELIAKEGGSSLSPGQMLADVLAETVQKDIKDATGLDIVVLEYNQASNAETQDEVKVTLGKELSRRVTVKYDVQTKNAKVIRKVITEYKFLEKMIMNAFQDTEGHYGGGIQFRLEFR